MKAKTFRPHKVKSRSTSIGSVSKIRRTKEEAYGSRKEWEIIRQEVFRRDRYLCTKCNSPVVTTGSPHLKGRTAHCDHIITVANGGKTVKSNLRTLCDICHSKLPRHHQHRNFILCRSK